MERCKERIYLDNEWKFTETFDDSLLDENANLDQLVSVRLPHTVKETPLHYFDEHEYQMVSGYVRNLHVPAEWNNKNLLLTVDGAAHKSEVYINGTKVGEHACGYTAFTMNISEYVNYDADNRVVIKVDSNETLNVPPFGYVIDYMTYGGIYRDVYLDVKEKSYLADVFVSTKQAGRYAAVQKEVDEESLEQTTEQYREAMARLRCEKSNTISEIKIVNTNENMRVRQSMRRKGTDEFTVIGEKTVESGNAKLELKCKTGDIELWDVDNPVLYEMKTELLENDVVVDESLITYGYRKAVFKKNGFYLNGRKLKLRGLNRHQSYPYVGYAMPESMQKLDADILKKELGLNAVRTSHYPQSHYFLDRCDELGLLVFTEFPGWQHIGDEAWKAQAVVNVSDMITQYRNHTSIILWGVRINESVDDDAFYKETNEVARALDSTRATGGVRCYKKSNLLEDVYTYNDFLHSGGNKGCDKKVDVTSDKEKPYLISEYMGHMYPTKAFDWEEHRVEHAIRHANVLDEVNKQEDIAGSFGWCMFDYNTHKDFGSGDRICYHGVMDMFRNPKLASAIYASQQEKTPVLELSSSMDIGEHPGCNRGETYIFTNADSVKMYKNNHFIKEFTKENSVHANLVHPPIRIDDYIGDLLEVNEKMPKKQAAEVKAILNEVAKFGLYNMSKRTYLKAGKMMLLYRMKMDDAVQLYNKYIGDWGGESTIYRFEAIKNGEVVKTIVKAPMTKRVLEVTVDHTRLVEKNSYDVAAVRIRAVDENGNLLPFYNDPVRFKTKGPIELIGPDTIGMSGGMGGCYVKTTGESGEAKLTVSTITGEKQKIEFSVEV